MPVYYEKVVLTTVKLLTSNCTSYGKRIVPASCVKTILSLCKCKESDNIKFHSLKPIGKMQK